ncbi:hypothetical protein [Neobacillus cucumis]|uniref:DUF3168 domain-containing protein n=1 Tax=Neobacillus cucumis TaxID=1740721 RepID=A0A2N5HET8_9BACI|nr:hypothetical protein [Neobacillus cucumis]PLS04022.1 hypothetical protein CVD27_12745 [Neobacillus cucumis]
MIKTVLKYILSDQKLLSLVGYTDKNKRINSYEAFNNEDHPNIVYEVSPFLASEGTTQYRCDIRVTTKDVLLLESISNRLLFLFHKKKTGVKINETIIYSSKHAGGSGIVFYPDYEVFEQTLTFNIKAN